MSSTVCNTNCDNTPFFTTGGHEILYYIILGYMFTTKVCQNSHKKWQYFTNTFFCIFLFDFWDPELISNINKIYPWICFLPSIRYFIQSMNDLKFVHIFIQIDHCAPWNCRENQLTILLNMYLVFQKIYPLIF